MAKRYPQHKIDQAMLAYYVTGSYRAAEAETGVEFSVIRRWITERHTARYHELVEQNAPKLREIIVDQLEHTARKANTVTDQALDAAAQAIADSQTPAPKRENYEDHDSYIAALEIWRTRLEGASKNAQHLSTAAKNGATVLGIVTEKSQLRQGLPTSITETRDLEDILKSLNTLVPGLVVDSTATEIPNDQAQLHQAQLHPAATVGHDTTDSSSKTPAHDGIPNGHSTTSNNKPSAHDGAQATDSHDKHARQPA